MARCWRLLIGCSAGVALACAVAPVAAQAETEVPPQFYSNNHLAGGVSSPVKAIAWGAIRLESAAVGKIECHNVMNFSAWNESNRGVGQFEGWGTNACVAPELEELLEKTYEEPIKKGLIKSPISVFATSELPSKPEFREAETCTEETKTKLSECESGGTRDVQELLAAVRRRATSFPWKLKLVRAIREEAEEVVANIGVAPAGQNCYPTEKVIEEGHEVERPVSWEKEPSGCLKIVIVCPQIPAEVVFYGTMSPQFFNGVKNGLSPTRMVFNKEAGELLSNHGEAPETGISGELKILGMNEQQLLIGR